MRSSFASNSTDWNLFTSTLAGLQILFGLLPEQKKALKEKIQQRKIILAMKKLHRKGTDIPDLSEICAAMRTKRYTPPPNGDILKSCIKLVASGSLQKLGSLEFMLPNNGFNPVALPRR